jgi:serine/threonine-protein kinase
MRGSADRKSASGGDATRPRWKLDDTMPSDGTCPACGARCAPGAVTCAACGAAIAPAKILEPGTVVGSYRLVDLLGQGGMGVVYLAEHTRLGRRVAIKMLRSEYTDNSIALRRFFAEARAVNKICHPHIVEITDFVERPGAENYYVMEYLEGASLSEITAGTMIPKLSRSIGIMAQVADALQAVHDANIVHRDLKPDNVYLIERAGQQDFVKLLDFGVAKLAQIGDANVSMNDTAAGTILGTPDYMSPEQASGKPVDYRTDIYAFGVMLYELVTGTRPVHAESFGELVVKHLTTEPVPPRKVKELPHDIPAALDDLILACLAKEPADRPDRMETVKARLFAIAEAEKWSITSFIERPSVPVDLEPLYKPRRRPLRTRTTLLAAIGAAVVGTAIGLFVASGGDERESRRPPVADMPAMIDIDFESTPAGAEVFRVGETAPIGKTPVTLTVERSTASETFELRLAGHETTRHVVRLDRASRIAAALPALPPPPPVVAAPAPEPPPVVEKPDRRKKKPKDETGATKPVDTPTGTGAESPDRSGVIDPFGPQ